jgi:hypothetical protein
MSTVRSATETTIGKALEVRELRKWVDPLILFALGAFAVTQPILSDFRAGAGYFVARRNEPIEIVLLVLVLTLLPGLIANLVVWAAGGFSTKARRTAYHSMVGLFAALICQSVLSHFTSLAPVFMAAVSLVAGLLAVWAYTNDSWFRSFLVLLGPAPVVFMLFFLLTPPVANMVFPSGTSSVSSNVESTTPVVFVVFDEFPVASLLDSSGAIDSGRFPNFARLASVSTWYKYTAAAHDNTMWALPALLTGEMPKISNLATAAAYPGNLFTVLGESHALHVQEPFTHLCPPELCAEIPRSEWRGRLRSLVADATQIYAMTLWPSLEWGTVIQDPFNEFTSDLQNPYVDPLEQFDQFLAGIDSSRSSLHFAHVLLPHIPFRYYPSGIQYNDGGDLDGHESELWVDSAKADQALQRHLLQVQLVDQLLGDLLSRLEEVELFEEAAVVVTADHGASYRVGVPRRAFAIDNAYEVGLVPLFVKAPHQTDGSIDVQTARSIDVLPTLGAHLGFELPWNHQGASLLGERSDWPSPQIETSDGQSVVLSEMERGTRAASAHAITRFGSGDSQGLFAFGPYSTLVGRQVRSIPAGPSALSAEVDELWRFAHVAPYTGFVPGFVHGQLHGPAAPNSHVAVAVNGKIRTVVPLRSVGSDGEFSAIIPDDAFVAGFNKLQVLSVSGASKSPTVQEIELDSNEEFELETARTGRVTRLVSSSGVSWPNRENSTIVGFVDAAEWYNSEFPVGSPKDLELPGWAIRVSSMTPVEAIVFFVNGVYAGSVRPEQDRADVAAAYETDRVRVSGFIGRLPQFLPSDNFAVRAFALSEGVAEELQITDEALADIAAG